MTERIAVVGLMGSGKSTLAGVVADRLELPVIDSDDQIIGRHGMKGRELAERHGLEALHAIERSLLLEALDRPGGFVVTPAASTVEDAGIRARLHAETFVVWLALPVPILFERLQSGDHRRLMTAEEFERVARRREPLYSAIAHLTISEPDTPDALADTVLHALPSGA